MEKSTVIPVRVPSPASSHRRLTITLYFAVAFLFWGSLYLYLPTLPTYVQSKADNLAMVGIVLSMYGLWQALIRLPLGIAADWLGWRKPFIIGGLALAGVGALLMARAEGVDGLLVGRAITGLAAGAWVPLIVSFSGLFPPGEVVRAAAMLTAVNSTGRVMASGATGWLNEWGGYALPFYLAAVAAGLGIIVMMATREPRRPPKRPSIASIGHLSSRRDVLLPALLAAVSQYANWSSTFSFIPILARQLGATDVTLSILLSMHIGVVVLGNLTTTASAKRFGSRRLAYVSFGMTVVGISVAAVSPALWLLFVAQFCIGLGQGVSYPTLMGLSIRYVADTERTTAMGLHQAVYAAGMFAGPWISGRLADAIGLRPMLGVTAFVCLGLSLFLISRLFDRTGGNSDQS